ncbi:hypothetical protein [Microbacterium sp.]|uniref:hypothetical protein n=1 Tax=Microbacterium sp. TaxID=51671 RepID=UPI0039E66BF1
MSTEDDITPEERSESATVEPGVDVASEDGTEPADAGTTPTDAAPPAEHEPAEDEPAISTESADAVDGIPPQYGIGPFSIREVALAGVWLLAFAVSFLPVYGGIGQGPAVWGNGIDWVLTIGVPTVAVFLLALRRMSPEGIRRVGSLGVDQFASVAFSVAVVAWLGMLWSSFVSLADSGLFFATWVVWAEVVLMLGGVVLTVVAPALPVLGEDFQHRPESVAHRSARRPRPVSSRPPAARTEASPVVTAPAQSADAAPEADAAPAPSPVQAFWALVPVERDVVDETGAPLFRIGPTAWALVIEDRGTSFVVRHEDGRVGYLHDVSGVTRG